MHSNTIIVLTGTKQDGKIGPVYMSRQSAVNFISTIKTNWGMTITEHNKLRLNKFLEENKFGTQISFRAIHSDSKTHNQYKMKIVDGYIWKDI